MNDKTKNDTLKSNVIVFKTIELTRFTILHIPMIKSDEFKFKTSS